MRATGKISLLLLTVLLTYLLTYESSGELSDISDPLSDITEIISDVGTVESDVDTEEDIQPTPGRNANPWFSVIDRETFQLNVEGFVAGKD